jgi:uncharacterized protein involved in response to NO
VPAWLALRQGVIASPLALPAAEWHAHELLLGYAAAVVAGFLLPRQPPLVLALLVGGWWLGRALVALIDPPSPVVLVAADFPLAVAALLVPKHLRAARTAANRAMALVPLGLALGETAWLAAGVVGQEWLRWPILRLVLDLLVLLLALMGGRIIRAATAGAAYKRGRRMLVSVAPKLELATLVLLLVAMLAAGPLPQLAAAAAIAAGLVTLRRLTRWLRREVCYEPDLMALYLGYLWVPVGLVMTGLARALAPERLPDAMHALTIGALATLTLTMMARVTGQRDGRGFEAAGFALWPAILLGLAAIARLGGLLWLSGLAWTAAFALALPLLISRRATGAGTD